MTNPTIEHSVLFVCMGNICRSPAAEGVLQRLVLHRNLADRVLVESAGTIGYHAGELPDPRMRAAASRRGLQLLSRARQVQASDLSNFDLIVPMDHDNRAYLERFRLSGHRASDRAEIRLLSDFLSEDVWPDEVPDPYYGGEAGFEFVLDMLEAACPNILDYLLKPRTTRPNPDDRAP